ncbi:cold shock domain-containing protein [Thalassotalea sp. Y01]|uniref:cold shock domain-containing protein n=1 Tax=Thalassotalea sp. Y01 TaxID=2729613 RepID=UPI00145D8F59|nr:cold shock domain-containing protein [Thalassotalea sp. Y01]NMP16667.1 cold shock domain-containing protein [Thalassotalea sp. Y01]
MKKYGKLVRWNNEKGFGFINCDQINSDVFIHISELKHMSREPKSGDFIYFDIALKDGKKRAVSARIEGVKSKQVNSSKRAKTSESSSIVGSIFTVMLLCTVGYFIYSEVSGYINRVNLAKQPIASSENAQALNTSNFPKNPVKLKPINVSKSLYSCDGRQYCSQMTSYEEAVFFINNCPATKMDGDNDGDPCESQF